LPPIARSPARGSSILGRGIRFLRFRRASSHISKLTNRISNSAEEFVDDKDQTSKLSYEAKIDGKDYRVTGDPDTDSVSLRRVNERKIEFATKKAGKVTSKFDATVSKDGKTTTVSGTDTIQGKPQKVDMVYDKQ
jgi:hypothetical protein